MTESEAGRFAVAYGAVRSREPWAESDRRRRARAIAGAVDLMRRELGAKARIVDVGAGAMRMEGVVAIDIGPGADVRGDMLALPLRAATVDGLLYAAALHYGPIDGVITEASRVLRPRGILIAIDSPIYRDRSAAAAALARSQSYYASQGSPELAAHYHPIDAGALRAALGAGGLELTRLSFGGRWRRLLRRGPTSFVLARKLR